MCQQTAEYLVPCSTQSQFPYLWSAALHCTHGMAILGDPGADEMGVPSRSCNPRERNWEPLPIPPMSRPPPRAPRVSPAPAALPVRSQPQCFLEMAVLSHLFRITGYNIIHPVLIEMRRYLL